MAFPLPCSASSRLTESLLILRLQPGREISWSNFMFLRHSSVSVVIRLQLRQPRNRGLIRSRGKKNYSCVWGIQSSSRAVPASFSGGHGETLSLKLHSRGLKLTTRLHLGASVRTNGAAVLLLPVRLHGVLTDIFTFTFTSRSVYEWKISANVCNVAASLKPHLTQILWNVATMSHKVSGKKTAMFIVL